MAYWRIFDVGAVQFSLELGRKPEIFLLVDNVDEAYKTSERKKDREPENKRVDENLEQEI